MRSGLAEANTLESWGEDGEDGQGSEVDYSGWDYYLHNPIHKYKSY